MTMFFQILMQVVGGLGMFLYGMDMMSKSFQEITGNKLKEIVHHMTSNTLRGIFVGTVITAIIQSSSVTTVMVVGFVNAALMSLREAIGVILGANIGTTVTGWILVFKITRYGLPIMGIGALVFLFSKNQLRKRKSLIFVGLGLIFLGLSLMKEGMSPLKEMPNFIRFFHMFSGESYRGVILSAITGAALTSVLQSSSATVGITMALATQGLIIPTTAVALVLGENVGTTITAYLASLHAGPNAKRAAYAHIFIKLTGVSLLLPFFYPYAGMVSKLAPPQKNISEYIALSHTLFNVGNALIFIPFIDILLRLLKKIGSDEENKEAEDFSSEKLYKFPLVALEKSRLEIEQMIIRFISDLSVFIQLIKRELPGEKVELLFSGERYQDLKKESVFKNLTGLLHASNSKDILKSIRIYVVLADTMESLGDYGASLGKIYTKTQNNKFVLSEIFTKQIESYHQRVMLSLKSLQEITLHPDIKKITEEKKACQSLADDLKFVDPLAMVDYPEHIFMEILAKYRRINRHIIFMLGNLEDEVKF